MIANHHKYSGLLIAALLFFAGGHSDAASWRINNNANRKAHFTDINAAMSSTDVVDGDTLYIDPGCNITGQQNVTKQVTIVGTGYWRTRIFPWLTSTDPHDCISKGKTSHPYILQTL